MAVQKMVQTGMNLGVAAENPLIAMGQLHCGKLLFHPSGIVIADDAAGFTPELDDGIAEGADHAAFARPRFALLRAGRQSIAVTITEDLGCGSAQQQFSPVSLDLTDERAVVLTELIDPSETHALVIDAERGDHEIGLEAQDVMLHAHEFLGHRVAADGRVDHVNEAIAEGLAESEVQVMKPIEATLGVAADHIVRVADGNDGDRGLGPEFFEDFIHGLLCC
jgi:hypothetical protein